MYFLGYQLYEYYLDSIKPMNNSISGKLRKTGMQYYLQTSDRENYAIRFLDVNALNLSKDQIGADISAEIMDTVLAPEGFQAYCRKIQFLPETDPRDCGDMIENHTEEPRLILPPPPSANP